ncbi:PAS domain-containing protein, partial [candidate division GN15 bacterium]|nr:PAS domain-containing protein [candidate division GN15 bacterium]
PGEAPYCDLKGARAAVTSGNMYMNSGGTHILSADAGTVLIAALICVVAAVVAWYFGRRYERFRRCTRQRFLQQVLDTIPAPVFYKGPDGRYEGCNRAFEDLTGRSRRELIGRSITDIAPRHIAHTHRQRDKELLVNGGSQVFEADVQGPGDRPRRMMIHKAVFTGANGEPAGIVGVMMDVTSARETARQLRKTCDLLDAIIETMPNPVFVKDEDHRWMIVNTAFADLIGATRAELLGKSDYDYFSEEEAEEFWRKDSEAFAGDCTIDNEEPLTDTAGNRHLIHTRKRVFTDPQGGRLLVGVISDITRLKETMNELEASTRVWQDTFDSISEAITVHDADGTVIRANQAAGELTNIPLDELIGRQCSDVYHCHLDSRSCRYGQCPKSVSSESVQVYREDIDRHFEIRAFPRRGANGNPLGYIHVVRDTTETVHRNAHLIRLSTAVAQSANMIAITDADGVVQYVNPRFTEITGYAASEIVGQRMSVISSGETAAKTYHQLWETILSGKTWSGTLRNRRKSGELFWERQVITPVFDDQRDLINFIAIKEDITQELETRQQLAEAEKMATVGTLAAGVAHEFKNYLGGIIGNASYTLDELADHSDIDLARETLENIVNMGERANSVAMSLLTYSRTDDEFRHEDLRSIVRNTIGLVKQELHNRSIELVTYFEEVPLVSVAAGKLQQLLLNLIVNSAHAIRFDGVVAVSVTRTADAVCLSVGDSGQGIAPDIQEHIFDPFYSTKGVWGKAQSDVIGSGLGLSICRNIAREHGGDLTCRSVEGLGTTFTLSLPRVDSAPKADSPRHRDTPLRVLLFTLDKSLLTTYFEDATIMGAELSMADHYEALERDLSHITDLVICDGAFPGKIELSRLVDRCAQAAVPCAVVNLAGLEYQLSSILHESAARFSRLPEFKQLVRDSAPTAISAD